MLFRYVREGLVLRKPRRVVERADEKLLRDCAVGFFLHRKLDGVTLRLVQDKLRDLEKRIATSGHLDLARERFDAIFGGDKCDGDFRQRWRRFGTLAAFVPVIATVVAARKSRFAVAKLEVAARRAATTFAARTIAARGAAFAG